MFNFFKNKNSNKKTDKDKQLLSKTASLLIHAAKIDENYTDIEKNIIKKALMNLYDIKTNEAEKLLKDAEIKERDSNQIVEFTQEIKKNSMEFRLKIIEILWKIVYSDGANDNYESNLIRRICGLLYVSDRDSGIIKLKIKDLIKNKWLILLMINVLNAN